MRHSLLAVCFVFMAMESAWGTMSAATAVAPVSVVPVNAVVPADPPAAAQKEPQATSTAVQLSHKQLWSWLYEIIDHLSSPTKDQFRDTFWYWSYLIVVLVSIASKFFISTEALHTDGVGAVLERLAKSWEGFGFVRMALLTLVGCGIATLLTSFAKFFIDASGLIPDEVSYFLFSLVIGSIMSFVFSMELTGTPYYYYFESTKLATAAKFFLYLVVDSILAACAFTLFAILLHPDSKELSTWESLEVSVLALLPRLLYSVPMQNFYVIGALKDKIGASAMALAYLVAVFPLYIMYFSKGYTWRPTTTKPTVDMGWVGLLIAFVIIAIGLGVGFRVGRHAMVTRTNLIQDTVIATRSRPRGTLEVPHGTLQSPPVLTRSPPMPQDPETSSRRLTRLGKTEDDESSLEFDPDASSLSDEATY